jgi:hypothetical protein
MKAKGDERESVTSSEILSLLFLGEKRVSQNRRVTRRGVNSTFPTRSCTATHCTVMLLDVFVFFVRVRGLLQTDRSVSGAYSPHTTRTVSVATLRSRQRVTKEIVEG